MSDDTENFRFPFEPYTVQKDFMKKLYKTLEDGRVGIFESPTGTGKSLSIICSAIKWLKDHQQRKEAELLKKESDADLPDWVNEQFQEQVIKQRSNEKESLQEKLARRRNRVLKSRKRFKRDKETGDKENFPSSCSDSDTEDEIQEEYCTKIFYCSRTHSQLSQFVHEVRKSPYAKDVKLTVLGSRGNLCTNPAVNHIKCNSLINERCLELRQGGAKRGKKSAQTEEKVTSDTTKKKNKCKYYTANKVQNFATHILSEVQDVEELVRSAVEATTCPYYATRSAVAAAEVVLLPYNMMLHKQQRKSLNIKLKDSVVIIDEAHNLIETINEVHSVAVHQQDCKTTLRKLNLYFSRVKSRLSPVNLLHCKQVVRCVSLLTTVFNKVHTVPHSKTYLFTIRQFQDITSLADINMFELVKFITESHMPQKIQGYGAEPGTEPPATPAVTTHTRSVLPDICSLFTCLTQADTAGRVLVVCDTDTKYIRYISLNCQDPFLPLLAECRSVILAGGTMEPIGEVMQQLLSNVLPRDVTVFSCGHVIPPSHLLPMSLSHGKTQQLDFSFQGRKKPGILQEVGNILLDVCKVVPGGVVCFLPSYQTLTDTKQVLQQSGSLSLISKMKTVFWDEGAGGGKGTEVGVLDSYSNRIVASRNPLSPVTGAVLFSVLGGRMSEGINFSNDLGRCVLVVGLPFANPSDPVLQEKMKYLNNTLKSTEEGRSPGQSYYENKCMKAVNQAVGRAIRHANDYSTILLLDKRYSTPRISTKLPGWIRKQLVHKSSVEDVTSAMQIFFQSKQSS